MHYPTREQVIEGTLDRIRCAGSDGALLLEVTPRLGGIRRRDVDILIARGLVEWVIEGRKVRLAQIVEPQS